MAKWEEAPDVETTPKWMEAPDVEEAPKADPAPAAPAAPKTWKSRLSPAAQAILAGGSGAIAQPIAGWAGIGASLIPGVNAADVVGGVQNALTFEPESEAANTVLGALSYPFEKFAQGTTWAGEKIGGDIGGAIGGFVGEALPTLVQAGRMGIRKVRGPKPVPLKLAELRARAAEAREAGYKVPPAMAEDTGIRPHVISATGKLKLQQQASIANASVTDDLVKGDLGIPKGETITPGVLEKVRSREGQHYEAIKSLPGKFTPPDAYIDKLFAIGKDLKALEKEFPKQATYSKEIKPLIDSLAKPMTPANAINMIKQLREDSKVNLRGTDPAKSNLGYAQKAAAKLLEDMIESNLETIGKPELLSNFRNARETIAKSHTVEKALNKETGTVDARILGSELNRGKLLTGGMRKAAGFAQAFNKAAQTPEMIGGVSPYSVMDLGAGVLSAGIGVATGGLGAIPALAMVAKPLVRSYGLSDPYQKGQIPKPKGPLSQAWDDSILPIPGLSGSEKPWAPR